MAVDDVAAGVSSVLTPARLVAPPPPDPVLVRPRLVEAVRRGVSGPVTVVRAPAGWGKTTLLSTWFRDQREVGGVVWFSVAAGDRRLWPDLHTALALPEAPRPSDGSAPSDVAGPSDLRPLSHPPPPSGSPTPQYVDRMATRLAAREEPLILVLDDLDRLADPAEAAVLETLTAASAGRLHLLVGARTEPPLTLHRLRLSGELAEIGATDLAFTVDETADLLTAHAAVLPAADVPELVARTEGWPAGLRLAARALAGHPDPAAFVTRFGGDQPEIADYLDREVLRELSAAATEVLSCATVTQPVTGALVDALTGRDDGDRTLAELEQRTGFLQLVGTQPSAYRCHWLLSDLLTSRLRQARQERTELHHRAAQWYAGHDQPVEALRHALAAGRWEIAADLVRQSWPELLPYGPVRTQRPLPYGRGEVAVASTDPPPEAVRAEPLLALGCAALRLATGDLPAADRWLAAARDKDAVGAAFALARAQLGDDPAVVRTAVDRLLETADGPPDESVQAVARTALGLADLAEGRLSTAQRQLASAHAAAVRARLVRVGQVAASRLAAVAAVRGQLRLAEQTARLVLTIPPEPGRSGGPDSAYAYLALAVVDLHRDRPAEAAAQLGLATSVPVDGVVACAGGPVLAALAALCQAELLRDRGELAAGCQLLADAVEGCAGALAEDGELAGWLRATEAAVRTSHGDLETARELLEHRDHQPPVAVALARLELYAGTSAAGQVLPAWDDEAAEAWPLPVRLDAGLLDAQLAARAGDERRAARTVERVLALAEPEGIRRVFTRGEPAVRDLLARHLDAGTAYWPTVSGLVAHTRAPAEGAARAEVTPLVEPLTERELTILRYLQSILSNVEIAGELSLSVNTVKTHVRNIYRKLDATRRREAVRRARELRLL